MMSRERECRSIVSRIRSSRMPLDLAAFDIQSALISANLCRLVYVAFSEHDYDPNRDLVPIDEPYRGSSPIDFSILELLRLGDFGEAASFAIDTYFVKVVGIRKDDAIFVAMRGTKGLKDWLINLRVSTEILSIKSWEEGEFHKLSIHAGFLNLVRQIRRGVIRSLAILVDGIKRSHSGLPQIVVCGHSLGGALALLFSARFNESNYGFTRDSVYAWQNRARSERYGLGITDDDIRVDSVYSFGAPMVGKDLYAKNLNVMHHRIVANGDLVPHLPSGLIGFEHDSDALLLEERGPVGVVVRRHDDVDVSLRKSIFNRNPLLGVFDNHSVDRYLRLLNALA